MASLFSSAILSLFFLVSLFLSISNSTTDLKGIDLGHPVVDLTPFPLGLQSSQNPKVSKDVLLCERAKVSGLSRLNLGNYASLFRVTLVPSVVIPEKLHSKILVCFHRNASLELCQCGADHWKPIQKGMWTSIMSPYEDKYIDTKFLGDFSGSVTVTVEEDSQRWRYLCLAIGFLLLLFAPVVSSWVPFYYSSSMAIGVFLVVLIILFQGMKLMPAGRKNIFYLTIYGSVIGAGSFLLHHFSMLVNSVLVNFGLSEDMFNPVAVFAVVGIILAGAALGYWIVRKFVISKDGTVDNGVAQFVKWAMRILATTFILQSTYDTQFAIAAVVTCWTSCFLISKWCCSVHQSFSGAGSSLAWRARNAAARHHRAEFLSRSPKTGTTRKLWASPKSPYSWSGSPIKGTSSYGSHTVGKRGHHQQEDYYSVLVHKTPNRRKFTKQEWEDFTRESTRQAVAELAASPEFTDWIIDHSDRIKLLPSDNSDSSLGSEADSTDETAVGSDNRFRLFKW